LGALGTAVFILFKHLAKWQGLREIASVIWGRLCNNKGQYTKYRRRLRLEMRKYVAMRQFDELPRQTNSPVRR